MRNGPKDPDLTTMRWQRSPSAGRNKYADLPPAAQQNSSSQRRQRRMMANMTDVSADILAYRPTEEDRQRLIAGWDKGEGKSFVVNYAADNQRSNA